MMNKRNMLLVMLTNYAYLAAHEALAVPSAQITERAIRQEICSPNSTQVAPCSAPTIRLTPQQKLALALALAHEQNTYTSEGPEDSWHTLATNVAFEIARQTVAQLARNAGCFVALAGERGIKSAINEGTSLLRSWWHTSLPVQAPGKFNLGYF